MRRNEEVTMEVFVQRGGPAFVLDGYQWYSNTVPLCRVMRGGRETKGEFGGDGRQGNKGITGKEKEQNKSTLPNKKHTLD